MLCARTILLVIAVVAIFSSTKSFAQGALDWADPCVKQNKKFKSTAAALSDRADAVIQEWDKMQSPPPELLPLYEEAIRTAAYRAWSENDQVASLLKTIKDSKPDFDAKKHFLETVYPKVFDATKEKEIIADYFKADYIAHLRPKFLQDREQLRRTISEQKSQLASACKPDVFNQVMRVTFGNATLIVKRNFDAAKDEKNIITQAVRGLTGASMKDIAEKGILGGDDSTLRAMANSFAGGRGSEVRKGLRSLDEKLNPARWKP